MAAVDSRYARALAQVASDEKLDVASVEAHLHDFATMLAGSSQLREVLMDPSIPEGQKLGLLDAIGARTGMSRPVRNFVALVAQHGRLHELGDMIAAFHALADEEKHVREAEVVSARPMGEDERRLIEQKIADLTGGERVKATYREDASLLGGAIVRIGSTVYDGSVRAQLEQMKQRMLAAA